MADHGTAIEWTHRPGTKGETWNPIVAYRWVDDPKNPGERIRLRGWYCEHASTGCIFCYSEVQNEAGYHGGTKLPYKPGHRKDVEIELHEQTLLKPLHWREPRTIFVCSMSDLYGEWVTDEMLDRIKAVQALTPQHTYIDLTKRADRMRGYTSARSTDVRLHLPITGAMNMMGAGATQPIGYRMWPLPNVWLGVSAERQQEADERREPLRALAEQGWLTFVSYEPAIGPVDWSGWEFIRWMISGGESGSEARPSHPQWHRDTQQWCERNGIAYFFKQFGRWLPMDQRPGDDPIHTTRQSLAVFGDDPHDYRNRAYDVGKKAAGRLLDGRTHDGFPEVRA